jgi:TolB-like protein/Flp pilus assembly protein TadD
MAVAELRLLGGFELRLAHGEVVDLLGQKDRALLAILALPAGATHSRDKLASLLWSDRGEQQARDSLKHSLTKLRQCLPAAAQSSIVADRSTARLDPAAVAVDVATFEKLAGNGSTTALEQAVALYRGELLDGIGIRDLAFEEWLLVERQRLGHLLEEVLTKLLSQLMADGASERAIATARRLLSLDPLREEASRALMQIHAERGQTAQALKMYETLCDRLESELDAKPDPATTALYHSLRGRTASIAATPAHDASLATPPSLPDKPSIAVLPFENLSNDPEQQYFSDGITEDIITELSRFHSLFVIAYHSSFAFKGKPVRIQDVGRELGVAYVVEGSVRRAADRVRISAQLVDAATGNHLWAERYDRHALDIFAVQDEVARSVASTVSGRVEVAGRDRIERLSPTALRAYDLVLRAKSLMLKYNRADTQQALACAERAMQLDPASAAAHAHAAWCHFYNYMAFWSAEPAHSLAKAYEFVQRAVVLDETESFAHAIMGSIQWFRREFDQARAAYLEAIERNPNDFLAQRFYGMFLTATGNPEAGIEQINLAKRLNPFDTKWVPWNTGIACFTARRYDDAITALKQVRNPINEVRAWLAASYALAGRRGEAKVALDEFMRVARSDMAVFPGNSLKDWEPYWHAMFEYQYQKDFDHLYEALRKAGMTD